MKTRQYRRILVNEGPHDSRGSFAVRILKAQSNPRPDGKPHRDCTTPRILKLNELKKKLEGITVEDIERAIETNLGGVTAQAS